MQCNTQIAQSQDEHCKASGTNLIIELKCQNVESRVSGFRNNMLLLTFGPPALSCPDTCQIQTKTSTSLYYNINFGMIEMSQPIGV
jgi:hypothetical protein